MIVDPPLVVPFRAGVAFRLDGTGPCHLRRRAPEFDLVGSHVLGEVFFRVQVAPGFQQAYTQPRLGQLPWPPNRL